MRYIKILIITVLIAVLLFFFLKNVEFGKVYSIISQVNIIYPLLFLVGIYAQYYIRAYRWKLLLKPHKPDVRIFTLYSYTVIGFFISAIIPGKVGEPAKGILMAGEENIKRSYGLASVVLERLIDLAMMILLLIISVFFIGNTNSQLIKDMRKISLFILPFIFLFFFLFYYLNRPRVFGYVEKVIRFCSKMVPKKIREKTISFSLHFVKGLSLELSAWDYIKLLVSSLIVWLFLIPFYWILMQGFSFGSNVSIMETIPYFCIIAASATIPTPGMAGSFDAVSRHALEKMFMVDTNSAAAYTILCHFLILAIQIIPGMIAAWQKGINLKMITGMNVSAGESESGQANEMS